MANENVNNDPIDTTTWAPVSAWNNSGAAEEAWSVEDIKTRTEDALDTVDTKVETLESDKDTIQEEVDVAAEEKKDTTENYYDKTKKIIEEEDKEIWKIEKEQVSSYEDRIERDSVALEDKKDEELSYLKSEAEYQRIQNENTILEAKQEVEIQRQQSAWAFNKLGLWFSSWIILQSQQIATNWIAKIAEIKASMNRDQAELAYKIANTEFEYTSLINQTIDTYTDKIDTVKKEMKTRISANKQNLLTNTFQKKQELEEIKDWARTEKERLEKEYVTEMQAAQDRGIQLSQSIKAQADTEMNAAKTNINNAVTDWSLFNMSDIELSKLASKAWITLNEINSLKKTKIASAVSWVASMLMWEDYVMNENERMDINNKVNSLLQGWKTLQEATEIATKEVLSKTDKYKNKVEMEELEDKALKKQLTDALISSWSWTSWYTPKASDMDKNIEPDWTVTYTNKVTWNTWVAQKVWTQTIVVPRDKWYSSTKPSWFDEYWTMNIQTYEPLKVQQSESYKDTELNKKEQEAAIKLKEAETKLKEAELKEYYWEWEVNEWAPVSTQLNFN